MRGATLLVLSAFLLAGCSDPAWQYSEPTPSGPTSTRDSRPNGGGTTGLATAAISQDASMYNFTKIAEFEVRARANPAADPPRPTVIWLGGNTSFCRVTTTFFVNGLNPVHSGYGIITVGPINSQAPTMVATWRQGGLLASHRMTGFIVAPSPGYNQAGQPQKAIREERAWPTEVVFSMTGWGDVYAKVLVEDAELLNQTQPAGGSLR